MRKYLILGETMTQAHQNGIQEYQQTQQSEPNYDPDFASHFILVGNGDLVLSDKPQQPVATFGLGKGLSEPCSPYRQAMFFGASLFSNDQLLSEVSGWNCAPDMVGPVADIVHTPPALTLYFTNPVSRQDANRNDPVTTHWSVNMYDPVMHSWEGGEIVPLSDPIILHPRSNTFLLVIYEWYGPYSYGPYLITIPEFGTYTFDGKAKTINGQPVTDMTAVANQSDFYGTLISTTGDEPPPRYWNATIRVNDSVQVGGENWGRFFIGDTIEILLGAPEMTAIEVGPNGEYHISAVLVRALWGRWRWVWSFYAQGYSGP